MKLAKKILLLTLLCSSIYSSEKAEGIASYHLSTTATKKAWHRIGEKDHYGIDVPLLSLKGEHNYGCGDFYDIFPLIDWIRSMGMDILQFLPLNDTGDIVSPYSALSYYALHPIYLSLDHLPFLSSLPMDSLQDLKEMKKLNDTKRVEYSKVLKAKTAFLEEYFAYFKDKLTTRSEYLEFMRNESYWITDYALFKVLLKRFGPLWQKWPKELQSPSSSKLDKLKSKYKEEMIFYQVVQSLLFEQLEKVHHYANQNGMFLFGDLTFLVDTNSSAVWLHPSYYKINMSMGVPEKPDYPKGQYWGLPPYNWDVIKKSHDQMLTQRVKLFRKLYDLYRLDSCLGYFWQYEIPINHPAKDGSFVPKSEEKAIKNGSETLLSFVEESPDFLPMAEAFSMTPKMHQVLIDLGITKLKTFVGNNTLFPAVPILYNGDSQPPLEIFMLSNHDNLPIRRWWYENPEKGKMLAKHYGWKYQKNLTDAQQKEFIEMSYNCPPLFHINMLYDLIPGSLSYPPEEEGINIPGTQSDLNWTYRFKLSVDELIKNPKVREFATPKVFIQTKEPGSSEEEADLSYITP